MLELKDIFAGYGKKNILNGVCASFGKGKLTSIIGANGCGKSTLLKTAVGILPHSKGEIEIDDCSVKKMTKNDRARKTAYLAQTKDTPDMSVEQMVLHGRFAHLSYPRIYTDSDRAAALDSMKKLGISEVADSPVSSLSGGMRQNAYIAMALTQDTDYILLDEPTTYLDIANQIELMKLLRSLADSGKGRVAVTHELSMAFGFSDVITVMDDGKILMQDTPNAVYRSGIIEDIFKVKIEIDVDKGSFGYCLNNVTNGQ